ncbi:hypothetical protein AB0945_01705 [Streptomyces sp. NPDC005474]
MTGGAGLGLNGVRVRLVGHDDWWPGGTPDLDPVGALTGLGNPTED